MRRIFIAEDDEVVREELKTLLSANGYQPVDEPPCDLALLDINLPGENGFSICRKIKAEAAVPVIFLTARDDIADELYGFNAGGDDYIRKPYNAAVLLARIARFLKQDKRVISAEGLTLDEGSFTLKYGDKLTTLSKTELRIMSILMQKPLCTREEIIEGLWTSSWYLDENTLYVNINRLLEKLKDIGAQGYIKTVRGVGYSL